MVYVAYFRYFDVKSLRPWDDWLDILQTPLDGVQGESHADLGTRKKKRLTATFRSGQATCLGFDPSPSGGPEIHVVQSRPGVQIQTADGCVKMATIPVPHMRSVL